MIMMAMTRDMSARTAEATTTKPTRAKATAATEARSRNAFK